jgi:hypothetical protein
MPAAAICVLRKFDGSTFPNESRLRLGATAGYAWAGQATYAVVMYGGSKSPDRSGFFQEIERNE